MDKQILEIINAVYMAGRVKDEELIPQAIKEIKQLYFKTFTRFIEDNYEDSIERTILLSKLSQLEDSKE